MSTEKKTALSGYEKRIIVETFKNALLEYEQLMEDLPWFVSETPDLIRTCLEVLGEAKTQ